mmetsp:Transcript_29062/g.54379  ORF Transcript_29062/g.54379 Transcript_29062/m.54379 type:complete len:234 (+) Transcript_29062:94-795(+)
MRQNKIAYYMLLCIDWYVLCAMHDPRLSLLSSRQYCSLLEIEELLHDLLHLLGVVRSLDIDGPHLELVGNAHQHRASRVQGLHRVGVFAKGGLRLLEEQQTRIVIRLCNAHWLSLPHHDDLSQSSDNHDHELEVTGGGVELSALFGIENFEVDEAKVDPIGPVDSLVDEVTPRCIGDPVCHHVCFLLFDVCVFDGGGLGSFEFGPNVLLRDRGVGPSSNDRLLDQIIRHQQFH